MSPCIGIRLMVALEDNIDRMTMRLIVLTLVIKDVYIRVVDRGVERANDRFVEFQESVMVYRGHGLTEKEGGDRMGATGPGIAQAEKVEWTALVIYAVRCERLAVAAGRIAEAEPGAEVDWHMTLLRSRVLPEYQRNAP